MESEKGIIKNEIRSSWPVDYNSGEPTKLLQGVADRQTKKGSSQIKHIIIFQYVDSSCDQSTNSVKNTSEFMTALHIFYLSMGTKSATNYHVRS